MSRTLTYIGFGEAAQAFANGAAVPARAYDIKTDDPATRDAKFADYARQGVDGDDAAAGALAGARQVLVLVTADQALAAARRYAGLLDPGALWLDMTSVAPDTKRAAATAIHAAGARYVDVAILAPVHPLRRAVPLLVSGPHAAAGAAALDVIGFGNVQIVAGAIGSAASIKLIRSVMVKGLEALTAEWMLAAEAAGLRDAAIAALNTSWLGVDWGEEANYNLDRMMVHGLRRAAEVEEAAKMLDGLGVGSEMVRATAQRQRAIGMLGLVPGPTLADKLAALRARWEDPAE